MICLSVWQFFYFSLCGNWSPMIPSHPSIPSALSSSVPLTFHSCSYSVQSLFPLLQYLTTVSQPNWFSCCTLSLWPTCRSANAGIIHLNDVTPGWKPVAHLPNAITWSTTLWLAPLAGLGSSGGWGRRGQHYQAPTPGQPLVAGPFPFFNSFCDKAEQLDGAGSVLRVVEFLCVDSGSITDLALVNPSVSPLW